MLRHAWQRAGVILQTSLIKMARLVMELDLRDFLTKFSNACWQEPCTCHAGLSHGNINNVSPMLIAASEELVEAMVAIRCASTLNVSASNVLSGALDVVRICHRSPNTQVRNDFTNVDKVKVHKPSKAACADHQPSWFAETVPGYRMRCLQVFVSNMLAVQL